MAYDEILAGRIRGALTHKRGVTEKRMFGGLGFLLDGNMLVGIWKDSLVVRLGPVNYNEALQQPHVREFDITGKTMTGWVLVEPDGVKNDEQVKTWIEQSLKFVRTLPRK